MNFAVAPLGLEEMGKFLWEGREKRRERGRARIKKITKFAVAGSGIRTHDHRVSRVEP